MILGVALPSRWWFLGQERPPQRSYRSQIWKSNKWKTILSLSFDIFAWLLELLDNLAFGISDAPFVKNGIHEERSQVSSQTGGSRSWAWDFILWTIVFAVCLKLKNTDNMWDILEYFEPAIELFLLFASEHFEIFARHILRWHFWSVHFLHRKLVEQVVLFSSDLLNSVGESVRYF